MFISKFWIQAGIVIGVIILFIVSVYLNKKTKAPKGVDLPDKCAACTSNTCMIKLRDVQKMKEELKEYLDKCEDEDEQ